MLNWFVGKKKPMPVVSLNVVSPQVARERELGLLSQEQGPEPNPELVVGDAGDDRSWTSLGGPTSGAAESENYLLALAGQQARDGEFEMALATLKTAEEFGVAAGDIVAHRMQVLELQNAELEAQIVPVSISADAWYQQGNQRYLAGDFLGAIESYDQAIAIKADFHEAWNNRGLSLANLGRIEEAIESWDQAIVLKPDDHEAWYNRGLLLANLGRREEAIESWDQAIAIKADKHEAWYNRGVLLANLGRLEEAIESYDQAIAIKPDYHEAWFNRGISLDNLGRIEEAIASYDQAIALKLDFHLAWVGRGLSLANLGRIEEAIASYDQAIAIKADKHEAWMSRGIVLCDQLGRYEEAIASFDKVIWIKPDDYVAWHNRGISLRALGRNEEAIESYDQAIAFKPDFHEAWANRGIAAKISTYNSGSLPAAFNLAQPSKPSTAIKFNNPALNQRGFPGQLASLTEGLRQCPSPIGQGYLYRELGEAHWNQGRATLYEQFKPTAARDHWREARRAYDQALAALALDPSLITETLQSLQGLIRTCLALRDLPAARAAQTRGSSLFDQLRRQSPNPAPLARQFSSFSRLEIDLLIDEDQPRRALTQAEYYKNRTLTWILDDWNQTPTDSSYPQLRQLLTSGLTPTTAILYWHLSNDALTTFILTQDQPEPIVLDLDRRRQAYRLSQLLTDYKRDYATYSALPKDAPDRHLHPWRTKLTDRLSQLRQILAIDAIQPHLTQATQLILLPHRDLHLLPLQTYFDRPSTTLPSLQIGLNLCSEAIAAPTTLLNIDDPAIPDQTPLTFARIESALLRSLIPNHRHLQGSQATYANSLQAIQTHQGIFHFSGHGSHDPRNPENSAIGLTDQPLTAKTIASLDLSAYQLINLAACETGLTNTATDLIDLEYIGLASACLKARAQAVLSTLWNVNELSSAWLTIRFYQACLTGSSPIEALAIAQTWLKTITYPELATWLAALLQGNPNLDYRDRLQAHLSNIQENPDKMSSSDSPFADPYYWAGFTLSGR
jgi:tetratricopeptide (TPR) repeat protein